MTIERFKKEKDQFKLAAYNGNQIVMSHFTKNLIVIETNLTKTELFLKKGNQRYETPFEDETHVALNLYHYKGLLISQNFTEIYLLDFKSLQVLHKIGIGQHIRCKISINNFNDDINIIQHLNN